MVKAITSTLIGAALHDRLIASLDNPMINYLPEFGGAAYTGVSVKHLLNMTSGINWTEDYEDSLADVAERYIKPIAERRRGYIAAYLKTLSRIDPPGTRFYHNIADTFLLSLILSRVTGKTVADYCAGTIWVLLPTEK